MTTVLLLFLAVRGLLREEYELQLLHRTVPRRTVIRALVVVVLSVGFLFVGFLALLATQSRLSFMELGFEAVSAFGTVGLSLGVTPRLDASGITIVVLLMFVGRVGPLALAYGLGRSKKLPWRGRETIFMWVEILRRRLCRTICIWLALLKGAEQEKIMAGEYLVIGLGQFGFAVARELAERGAEVVAIDKEEGP